MKIYQIIVRDKETGQDIYRDYAIDVENHDKELYGEWVEDMINTLTTIKL